MKIFFLGKGKNSFFIFRRLFSLGCLFFLFSYFSKKTYAELPSAKVEYTQVATNPEDKTALHEKGFLRPGLTTDEVTKHFGPPDRKREDDSLQTQSWYYGESVIFFAQGQITGWSDQGELASREEMDRFRLQNHNPYGFEEKGWFNVWTPQKPESMERVIDEILQ